MQTTIAWSAISFLLGLLFGHRLNVARDKRKERNEAAAPIRAWAIRQHENPNRDLWQLPTVAERDALYSRLSKRRAVELRQAFSAALKEYGEATSRGEQGEVLFHGSRIGLEHIATIIRITRPQ